MQNNTAACGDKFAKPFELEILLRIILPSVVLLIVFYFSKTSSAALFIKLRISETNQAEHRGDIFMGVGYLPLFTPFHQVDFDTGYIVNTSGNLIHLDSTFFSLFDMLPLTSY